MITIVNSQKTTLLKIDAPEDITVNTAVKFSLEAQRFFQAISDLDTEQMAQAGQAKKLMKYEKMEVDKIIEAPDEDLEQIIEINKNQLQIKKSKMELISDLLVILKIEHLAEYFSFAQLGELLNFVKADPANNFPS